MAPAMKADEADYFAVMGLTPAATDAEIRRAHKKLSLALHPDKNRDMDAVEAATRFSTMQLAYEVLMDPSARLAAAERAKTEAVRKERRGAYDGKRKAMAEELEKREEEERGKKAKSGVQVNAQTLKRLREEGRSLREERERRMNDAQQQASKARETEDTQRQPIDPDMSARGPATDQPTTAHGSNSVPRFSFGKLPASATTNLRSPPVTSNESDILQRMRQAARARASKE